ncbi:MAG: hypothetical protein JKX68_08135 [Flavobacteriales bacterium]|nr:hypothetical protein [Flavobacteriales bacterium]
MQNRITTKIELDRNKNELNRFIYKSFTIDSNDYIIDETEYDTDSNIVCKIIYRYFDTGEVNEYIEYNPLDELLERHTYFKNDSGDIDKIEFELLAVINRLGNLHTQTLEMRIKP